MNNCFLKNILLPFLFLLILIQNNSFSQDTSLFSKENRKEFADYLYCQKDYLRAIDEYESIMGSSGNDTLRFRIGMGYLKMGKYEPASSSFSKVGSGSDFYDNARMEYFKSQFLLSNFDKLEGSVYLPVKKLNAFSYLLDYKTLPAKDIMLNPFTGNDRIAVSDFYERKLNPAYKSELTAVILSTLVPGAGKIYTKEYSDGIIAFLVTGILGYISYTDFKADHNFRGWLFAGLSTFFYAGNIYGSAASAQIYNAKVDFKLSSDMKLFLENKDYFVPDYEFCK
jgi:TM2 domain-containing membrane protein YozV